MKQILFLIGLCCFSIATYAQVVTGQLINEFDKQPIFGVTVYSDEIPIAFSDKEGKFEIKDASKITELTFSHLAFSEKKIKIKGITSEYQIIYLEEKATLLDEMVISHNKNRLTLGEIIKKSSRKFKECFKQTPYFAKVNAKQVILENKEYMGYLEVDGYLYNFVPKDNNPFYRPFLIPKEYRKNKENAIVKSKFGSQKSHEFFNYFGPKFLSHNSLFDYQVAVVAHPLFKKHKYEFKQLENEVSSGQDCYHVQFFQKKGIYVKRKLFNVYGEMWISTKDFSIVKHEVNYDFDDVFSSYVEIDFETKTTQLFVKKIVTETKVINRIFKSGTFIQLYLTIDNSSILDTKDISKMLTFDISYYIDEMKYDESYWRNKKLPSTDLIDNYLKTISHDEFNIGANQKLLDTHSKYFKSAHESLRVEQIKLHEETLKDLKL